MIVRFPGGTRLRNNLVSHAGLIFSVATSSKKSASLYEQTKLALEFLDENLSRAGASKSTILQATVYITDISRKEDMNRAWNEWVDRENAPQRACVGVALEGDDLVEIVVIAAKESDTD
jgi:enamine deaminase RidA (YjgF/YER057c/UK114 family)